jgi:hypothetical protein
MNHLKRACRTLVTAIALATLAAASCEARVNLLIPSHCRADEVTYFSCELEGARKVVSLCGPSSSPESNPAAGLEYRYGRFSSIELTLPSQHNRTADFFRGEHLNPYGENTVVDSVLFESAGVSYGISVRDGKRKFTGVWEAEGKKYKEQPCSKKVDSGSLPDLVLQLPPP